MESKVIVTLGDGFGKSATLYYTGEELIFYVKPKWPGIFFGLLGRILTEEKEKYRFHVKSIVSGRATTDCQGYPIYELYLNNNNKYTIEFQNNNDNLSKSIRSMIEKLGDK